MRRSRQRTWWRSRAGAVVTASLIALVAVLGRSFVANAFNVCVPVGDRAHGSFARTPDSYLPPFRHWDLREFATCQVPFTVSAAGTADIADAGEMAQIDSAARQWRGGKSVFTFTRQPMTTATDRFGRDDENVVMWDGGLAENLALFPPADDVALIEGGVGTLAIDASSPTVGRDNERLNQAIIGFGPDGEPNSGPVGDDIIVDAEGAAYLLERRRIRVEPAIYAGNNGRVDTLPNNGNVFGIACTFGDSETGVVHEVDIVLNDRDVAWNTDIIMPDNPYRMDVWSIVVHELGHMVGLHHVGHGIERENDAVMTPVRAGAYRFAGQRRNVRGDDLLGAEFLYSPDLGDAPDPLMPPDVGRYPTQIRAVNGRMLNGMRLSAPRTGAMHLFDDYEYLGSAVTGECSPRAPDADLGDDGVDFRGGPMFTPGVPKELDLTISYLDFPIRYALKACAGGPTPGQICVDDSSCGAGGMCTGRAVEALLYLNGWCDWNGDGDWEDTDEKVIDELGLDPFAAGHGFMPGPRARRQGVRTMSNSYTLMPPLTAAATVWCRFRLDRGEDAGDRGNVNGDLAQAAGVAQWGEVEDYRLRRVAAGVSMIMPGRTFCRVASPGEPQVCSIALSPELGGRTSIAVAGFRGSLVVDPALIEVQSAAVVAAGFPGASVEVSAATGEVFVDALVPPGDPEIGCGNLALTGTTPFLEITYAPRTAAPIGSVVPLAIEGTLFEHVMSATEFACVAAPLEDNGIDSELVGAPLVVVDPDGVSPALSATVVDGSLPDITIVVEDAGGSGVAPETLAVAVGVTATAQGGETEDLRPVELPAGANLSGSFAYDAEAGRFEQRSAILLPTGAHELSVAIADHAGNIATTTVTFNVTAPSVDPDAGSGADAGTGPPGGGDGCGCRADASGGRGLLPVLIVLFAVAVRRARFGQRSTRSRLRTLPLGSRGSSSTNSTSAGTL